MMNNAFITNYTYDPAGARTVTLNELTTVEQERLLYIIHLPTMTTLVDFGAGKVNLIPSIAGNVVTLNPSLSLTGHLPTDKLMIVYGVNRNGLDLGNQSISAAGVLFTLNDTGPYDSVSVEVISPGTTCTISYEVSNGGTNWYLVSGQTVSATGTTGEVNTSTAATLLRFALGTLRFRARVSTYGSGTVTVRPYFKTLPLARSSVFVANTPTVDTELPAAAAMADGQGNPTTPPVAAFGALYNETNWDRYRGNTTRSLEASSAKTASGQTAALTNHNARGIMLFVNVSAITGTTPTLAVRLQAQDLVSSGWVDIPGAVTASITATGLTLLTIYPGVVEVANQRISAPLPRVFRVVWAIGGTSPSFTFSVAGQFIL